MALASPVTLEDFETVCNGDGLLSEGESFEDFCCDDPDHGFYKCETPQGDVYFLQSSGFEFFFTPSGKPPTFFVPEYQEVANTIHRGGPLATLLLAAGDGRMQGRNGAEFHIDTLPEGIEVIEGRNTRFRLMREGEAIAGMKVDGSTITEIFVRNDERKQDIASANLILQRSKARALATKAICSPCPPARRPGRRS